MVSALVAAIRVLRRTGGGALSLGSLALPAQAFYTALDGLAGLSGLSGQTGTVPITNERNGHLNRVVKTTTQHSVQAPDLNRNYSSHSARRQSE